MWLFDEERPITCTFVSNELDVHTNIAKQMLYQFSQDNSEKVDATYFVSGIKKLSTPSGGKKRSVVIVKEARLNNVIDDFETVLSKHVYALSSKEPDVETISKTFATKLWYGDFQQRKTFE